MHGIVSHDCTLFYTGDEGLSVLILTLLRVKRGTIVNTGRKELFLSALGL